MRPLAVGDTVCPDTIADAAIMTARRAPTRGTRIYRSFGSLLEHEPKLHLHRAHSLRAGRRAAAGRGRRQPRWFRLPSALNWLFVIVVAVAGLL